VGQSRLAFLVLDVGIGTCRQEGQMAGKQRGDLPVCPRVHGAILESPLHRKRADNHSKKILASMDGALFYDQTGAIRDVIQNHLFQILCNLAMEPPVRTDSETLRDEKVMVLKAIPPLETKNLVRGSVRRGWALYWTSD
jgi:hypothetical protein